MEVKVMWDALNEVAVITYKNAKIDSLSAYEEWQQKLFPLLDQLLVRVGHKFPLAVGIDELSFSKEFEWRYGREIAPLVARKYATAIARFGGNIPTKMAVSNQAFNRLIDTTSPDDIKKEYGSNIFPSLKNAISFLLEITTP